MRLLGHSLHRILIVFPVGLLLAATGFDLAALMSGDLYWLTLSYWLIAAGIVTGLIAAVFGYLDWRGVREGSRASRLGAWHGAGNVLVVALFAVSFWLRGAPGVAPAQPALVFSFAGAILLLVTGWLGGELVSRLGVGIDRGAYDDAPSSLSTPTIAGSRERPSPGE